MRTTRYRRIFPVNSMLAGLAALATITGCQLAGDVNTTIDDVNVAGSNGANQGVDGSQPGSGGGPSGGALPPHGGGGSSTNIHSWSFDDDDQGWTLLGGAFVNNTRPAWSTGGLKLSGSGEGPWYFVSPPSFSGNQSALYGELLQFTLSRDTSCRDRMPGEVWQGVVVLSGGGWSIGWGDIAGSQRDFSGTLSMRLDEGETWFVVGSPDAAVPVGSRATRGAFRGVLGNLHELRIFGQRGYCDGVTTLDGIQIN